jgi:hypothetical protein
MHGGTVRHDEEPVAGPLSLMVVGLARLERREREVSALRRKLHDRLDSFPNAVTQRQERDVSTERRELHRRIDELRALLAAL